MLSNANLPNPFAKETQQNGNSQENNTPAPVPPRVPSTEQHLENHNQNPQATEQDSSDRWASLYETAKDDKGNPIEEKPETNDFSMASKGYNKENITKLSEQVSATLPAKEEMKEIMESGDPEKMIDMMQKFGQDIFRNSLMASSHGADQVFKETGQQMESSSEKAAMRKITQNQVKETLRTEFPDHYNKPAFRETADNVRDRMIKKYPDATPNEISGMMKDFIKDNYNLEPASSRQEAEQREASKQINWMDEI